jgi:predicted AAA+ superfamily ATPase
MFIERAITSKLKTSLDHGDVTIILGARQVGKTSLISRCLEGIHHHMLNLDVLVDANRLTSLAAMEPIDAFRSLGSPKVLVIDEVQNLPETGKIMKGWFDKSVPVKIVLLGSSSLEILDQTAEPLTGRNEKIFLPPLLFTEAIRAQSWYPQGNLHPSFFTALEDTIQAFLLERMVFGNYPRALTDKDRESYLLNLTSDYLLKDVFQLGLVKTPETIRKLLLLLAHQTGSEVSIAELADALSIARQTVERYIETLERTFVIFRLPAFGKNQRKEIVKNHKIFFWDTGVRNAILKDFSVSLMRNDIGRLWENYAISEFAKINLLSGLKQNLFFWRSRQGSEIDLVITHNETIQAIEMKWSPKRTAPIRAFQSLYGIKPHILNRESLPHYLIKIQNSLE